MPKKTLTTDCNICDLCSVNNQNKFVCNWGKSKKGKVMEPAKRKKGVVRCNLIKT